MKSEPLGAEPGLTYPGESIVQPWLRVAGLRAHIGPQVMDECFADVCCDLVRAQLSLF